MIAALHDSFIDFVLYMGLTERYPKWFKREVLDDICMDSERYTFWVPSEERYSYYYEQTLVEDYCVFLRKRTGEVACVSYDTFEDMYTQFTYDAYTNSGIAAYGEDTIEYVECLPGVLSPEYPDWFYEYFTESIHIPSEESIFIYDLGDGRPPISSSSRDKQVLGPLDCNVGQVSVDEHCVFLRNSIGEIKHMMYDTFLKYYNPGPSWKAKIRN